MVGGEHLGAEDGGVAPVGLGLLEGARAVAAAEALDGAPVAPVFDDVLALAVAAQEDLDDHERSLPQQRRICHYLVKMLPGLHPERLP